MKTLFFTLFILFISLYANAQNGVAINNSGNPPDNSAMLDLSSNSKGLLIPRMSTQERDLVSNPAQSLLIYNTTTKCFEFFENNTWQTMFCACNLPSAPGSSTHIEYQTQIIWKWNSVAGAAGYKWNSVNDYSTATDVGTDTTYSDNGLTCNTAYTGYVWAYNSCGNSPATTLTKTTSSCVFICGTSTVSDIEGNVYNTVQIGTQCWLKENLNRGNMIASFQSNGTTVISQEDNGIVEKYCYDYELDGDAAQQATGLSNCNTYGGLYQWAEAVQYLNGATNYDSWNPAPSGHVQGLCPNGWHIPTDAEWCTLELYLDPTVNCYATSARGTDCGTKLKTNDVSYPGNCNGIGNCNSSGFSSLAGGYRYDYGGFAVFSGFGVYGIYWTSTGFNSLAYNRYTTNDARSTRFDDPKLLGASIRCVKD